MRRLAMVVLLVALTACIRDPLPEDRPAAPSRPPRDDYGLAGRNCGAVAIRQGGGDIPDPARRCLDGAAPEGRAAHLILTHWTVEGDPIFTAYQVVDRETVDVVHDARWDGFGSGTLSRQRCRYVPGGSGPELNVTDCTEPA